MSENKYNPDYTIEPWEIIKDGVEAHGFIEPSEGWLENYVNLACGNKDAEIARLREALTACDEAMEYMSEYDIPLCLPEQVKQALKKGGK